MLPLDIQYSYSVVVYWVSASQNCSSGENDMVAGQPSQLLLWCGADCSLQHMTMGWVPSHKRTSWTYSVTRRRRPAFDDFQYGINSKKPLLLGWTPPLTTAYLQLNVHSSLHLHSCTYLILCHLSMYRRFE